ncbi:hypothetical protein [Sagittula salina]|uniref:Uncharacterized protein n=1 Tax=Sagittula salina TaxID=2820268 RepID=A0A940MQQ8_9RHOB|nr:hypothetical protein [Sagittula salina]MBP0483046.1 hypothetical protein [Sagittula salina]
MSPDQILQILRQRAEALDGTPLRTRRRLADRKRAGAAWAMPVAPFKPPVPRRGRTRI